MAKFGTVEKGWTPSAWTEYLEVKSAACRGMNDYCADQYQEWADKVKEDFDLVPASHESFHGSLYKERVSGPDDGPTA